MNAGHNIVSGKLKKTNTVKILVPMELLKLQVPQVMQSVYREAYYSWAVLFLLVFPGVPGPWHFCVVRGI